MSGKESLQHKPTRWHCEILGRWTTIASSKTWAGSATNMWTRCPRQAWPHSSLTIKHYKSSGEEPSSRISKSLHKSILALRKELLLLKQINQWLGMLGNTYGMEVINLRNHSILCTCMTNLDDSKGSKNNLSRIHGGNFHQMHVYKRKSLLSSNKYFMS